MPMTTLYRLAGAAGAMAASILLCNLGRRTGVVPDVAAVRAVAPLAGMFGLFALAGLYLRYARAAGMLGVAGVALNTVGLAGVVGVEYVTNYVFPFLSEAEIAALVDGLTGVMFLVTSVVFLIGVVTFALALWRGRALPTPLVAGYGAGFGLVALRPVLPEALYHVGLLLGVVVLAWAALHLLCDPAPADGDAAARPLCARLGLRAYGAAA